MVNIHTSSKKRYYRHVGRKGRSRAHIYLGTPQVPFSKQKYQQSHELLRDCSDPS